MFKKIMIALSAAVILGAVSAAPAMSQNRFCVQQYDSSGVPVAPYCR